MTLPSRAMVTNSACPGFPSRTFHGFRSGSRRGAPHRPA
ncbi:hypothetical protein SLNWT_4574 [Streptomyces albus]|uniref:Uncharacterized protein n=1 Tax=Streptomyces albus (strain ATCC 21838 / DSM 41398 / FERM P-419 / JCM 4703 / NBRC 107858) TaxID=1081613 RepID=A0A0B5F023_STRA4|nr:hypothetical protein SLNWT_4574 [Streptomyces albus]AOU79254.1 hypothetical protein SLNHY_4563 [Streptomyces albus]